MTNHRREILPFWVRATSLSMCAVFVQVNVVYAAIEPAKSFWSERKKAAAQLPTDFLPQVSHGFKSIVPVPNLGVGDHGGAPLLVGVEGTRGTIPKWFSSIPGNYVTLKDLYTPPGYKSGDFIIIHIQDAHGNVEAQQNIAKTIESLALTGDHGGAPLLVGIEGARGAFDFHPYQSFPDRDVTKEIADYFVKNSFITGPEYVGMTTQKPITFWGVEDEKPYLDHVQALKDATAQQQDALKMLERFSQSLEIRKDKELNPNLRELDKKIIQHKKGQLGLGEYLKHLMTSSPYPSPFQGEGKFPAILQFLSALQMEESLDYKQVESERASLTRALANELPKQELENLVKASLSYRVGNLTHSAFYQYLKELCNAYRIGQQAVNPQTARSPLAARSSLENYPELDKYIRYVLLSEAIKHEQLFVEVEAMEAQSLESLIKTPKEREVIEESSRLALKEKLVKFELSPEEWEKYWTSERGGLTSDGGTLATNRGVGNLEPFERFNKAAIARNSVLVENLLQKGSKSAVLIAGGFHTSGMTEILKSKQVAYAVLTPRLGKVEGSGTDYLSAFTRDKTPLEKLFTGERIQIAEQGVGPRSFMGNVTPTRLITVVRFWIGYVLVHSGNLLPQQFTQWFLAERIPTVSEMPEIVDDAVTISGNIDGKRKRAWIPKSVFASIDSGGPVAISNADVSWYVRAYHAVKDLFAQSIDHSSGLFAGGQRVVGTHKDLTKQEAETLANELESRDIKPHTLNSDELRMAAQAIREMLDGESAQLIGQKIGIYHLDYVKLLCQVLESEGSMVRIKGKPYHFTIISVPGNQPFVVGEKKVWGFPIFKKPESGKPEEITLYVRNLFANDINTYRSAPHILAGLIHEGLEHLVFPQDGWTIPNQRHSLSFILEAIAGGKITERRGKKNQILSLVAVPARVFLEFQVLPTQSALLSNAEKLLVAAGKAHSKFGGDEIGEYLIHMAHVINQVAIAHLHTETIDPQQKSNPSENKKYPEGSSVLSVLLDILQSRETTYGTNHKVQVMDHRRDSAEHKSKYVMLTLEDAKIAAKDGLIEEHNGVFFWHTSRRMLGVHKNVEGRAVETIYFRDKATIQVGKMNLSIAVRDNKIHYQWDIGTSQSAPGSFAELRHFAESQYHQFSKDGQLNPQRNFLIASQLHGRNFNVMVSNFNGLYVLTVQLDEKMENEIIIRWDEVSEPGPGGGRGFARQDGSFNVYPLAKLGLGIAALLTAWVARGYFSVTPELFLLFGSPLFMLGVFIKWQYAIPEGVSNRLAPYVKWLKRAKWDEILLAGFFNHVNHMVAALKADLNNGKPSGAGHGNFFATDLWRLSLKHPVLAFGTILTTVVLLSIDGAALEMISQLHIKLGAIALAAAATVFGSSQVPAFRLIEALGLSNLDREPLKIGVIGVKYRRISVPKRADRTRPPAQGREILQFQLANAQRCAALAQDPDFDLTQFDVILNSEGQPIAVFPVLPRNLSRAIEREYNMETIANIHALGLEYLDLGDFYFIPDPHDADLQTKWFAFVKKRKEYTRLIDEYRLNVFGEWERDQNVPVSRTGAIFSPYFMVTTDKGTVNLETISPLWVDVPQARVDAQIQEIRSSPESLIIVSNFPTVYAAASPVTSVVDRDYRSALTNQLGIREDESVCVIGPGSGLDSIIASQKTNRPIHAVGINPLEVANLKDSAVRAGFKVSAAIGNVFNAPDGSVLFPGKRFDVILWNMPNLPDELPVFGPGKLKDFWDDYFGADRALESFARALPARLTKQGRALIWNYGDAEKITATFERQGLKVEMLSKGLFLIRQAQVDGRNPRRSGSGPSSTASFMGVGIIQAYSPQFFPTLKMDWFSIFIKPAIELVFLPGISLFLYHWFGSYFLLPVSFGFSFSHEIETLWTRGPPKSANEFLSFTARVSVRSLAAFGIASVSIDPSLSLFFQFANAYALHALWNFVMAILDRREFQLSLKAEQFMKVARRAQELFLSFAALRAVNMALNHNPSMPEALTLKKNLEDKLAGKTQMKGPLNSNQKSLLRFMRSGRSIPFTQTEMGRILGVKQSSIFNRINNKPKVKSRMKSPSKSLFIKKMKEEIAERLRYSSGYLLNAQILIPRIFLAHLQHGEKIGPLTADDLIIITGFNKNTVLVVLQRLVRENVITKIPSENRKTPLQYQANDADALLRLASTSSKHFIPRGTSVDSAAGPADILYSSYIDGESKLEGGVPLSFWESVRHKLGEPFIGAPLWETVVFQTFGIAVLPQLLTGYFEWSPVVAYVTGIFGWSIAAFSLAHVLRNVISGSGGKSLRAYAVPATAFSLAYSLALLIHPWMNSPEAHMLATMAALAAHSGYNILKIVFGFFPNSAVMSIVGMQKARGYRDGNHTEGLPADLPDNKIGFEEDGAYLPSVRNRRGLNGFKLDGARGFDQKEYDANKAKFAKLSDIFGAHTERDIVFAVDPSRATPQQIRHLSHLARQVQNSGKAVRVAFVRSDLDHVFRAEKVESSLIRSLGVETVQIEKNSNTSNTLDLDWLYSEIAAAASLKNYSLFVYSDPSMQMISPSNNALIMVLNLLPSGQLEIMSQNLDENLKASLAAALSQ